MLDFLTLTLYHISNALLVPVIFTILGMLAWTGLLLGGFLREWLARRTLTPMVAAAVAAAREGKDADAIWALVAKAPSGLPARFARFVGASSQTRVMEQGLTEVENDVAASVARHSFITRVAPILGLMGTLIPLGPALSGLANGNMAALSGNLIVAFTATVVGLLISGVAYGMGLARRTWYSRDLSSLEFLVDTITAQQGGSNA